MSIELDNSAAAAATKLALPGLPPEMWRNIFLHCSLRQIMDFINHNKHKASGKKEVSTDRVLVLNNILHGMKLNLSGDAFSEVQLRNLYEEVFGTKLKPALGRSFVELVAKYRQDSKPLAISMSNPALLCSSDYMSKILGIDVTDWLRKNPDLFLDLVGSKLVKATAVHDTPELNIPGLAELQASQHSIDSALIHAAAEGSIEYAIVQIKNGADVEKQSQYGHTVLMHAVQRHNFEAVKYLVEKCGADVEKQNRADTTVLMYAAQLNNLELVKYLIEKCGADVEKQNKYGMTLLMLASRPFNLEMIKYLIEECGADVEKQDKDGMTALMHAADCKTFCLGTIRYLVEHGANPGEAKVALERACGQEVFAELESLFLDVTSEKIFNEVLGPIVQEEAVAFVDMDSPLAGLGPDLFASEQDFV